MSVKYMYLHAGGGLNDILIGLSNALKFCEETDRVLLFDLAQTVYGVPFDRYFSWPDDKVITDKSVIEEILSRDLSVFPTQLTGRSSMIMERSSDLTYDWGRCFCFEVDSYSGGRSCPGSLKIECKESSFREIVDFAALDLDAQEELIIHARCGGGWVKLSYAILDLFKFKKSLVDHAISNLSLLGSPYLFLHIRGTDYPSKIPVEEVIGSHKDTIERYEEVYLATDDTDVLDAFDKEGIPYKNFSTFPSNAGQYYSHHYSSVSGDHKIKDMFSDLFLCANAGEFIQSVGGFSKLLSTVHKNQKFIDKFYT